MSPILYRVVKKDCSDKAPFEQTPGKVRDMGIWRKSTAGSNEVSANPEAEHA